MTSNLDFSDNIVSGSGILVQAWRTDPDTRNSGPNTFFGATDNGVRYDGLDFNSYYQSSGGAQTVFEWKDPNGTATSFTALSGTGGLTAVRTKESNGQDIAAGGEPFFVSPATGDYRFAATAWLTGQAGRCRPRLPVRWAWQPGRC